MLIRKAVDNLLSNRTVQPPETGKSYFGHPGKKEGREFRKRDKFFRLRELIQRVP